MFIRPVIKNVRILSEEKEQQSARISSILENTKNAIWSVDLELKLVTFNSVFAQVVTKHSGEEPIIDRKVLGLTPFDCETFYKKAFEGEIFSTDFKLECEGKTTYHELSFHPIYDRNRLVIGCSVYQMEVTQRVEALQELTLSEFYLKEAQEISNMGNWNWNIVNGKVEWSEQFFRLCGKNPLTYEPDFEDFFSMIHPDDRESVRETLQGDLESKRLHNATYRIVRNDGEVRYLYTRGKFFYDENGKPHRMAGTTQDITAMEMAKTKILKQNYELQNFVYVVSHMLRAPVSTLKALTGLYNSSENDYLSNEELVRLIDKTVFTLDDTLIDLNETLSLKHVSKEQFEEVDLHEIMNNIELLLANDIESSKVQISRDFSEVQKILGIKPYLTNIFFNLIQNAIHYKSMHRILQVRVISNCSPNGVVSISVSDNGIGMSLNDSKRKKIFDMYGRLSGSSKGKGMGLYLVKTQVEAMEGYIEVESNPNSGSVFTVVMNENERVNWMSQVN